MHIFEWFSNTVYEGDLGPFLPLLRMTGMPQVGKYAVWGNGWIPVEVVA